MLLWEAIKTSTGNIKIETAEKSSKSTNKKPLNIIGCKGVYINVKY